MGKLSAKYQFCAIHTADNTDGKVTIDRRLTIDRRCPSFLKKVHRLDPPVVDPCGEGVGRSGSRESRQGRVGRSDNRL